MYFFLATQMTRLEQKLSETLTDGLVIADNINAAVEKLRSIGNIGFKVTSRSVWRKGENQGYTLTIQDNNGTDHVLESVFELTEFPPQ